MTGQTGARRPRASTITITSGKGGVGKTSLTVNLAASLARLGHRVGVLDADFGLGNLDVMLGLAPGAHLGAVLSGEKSLADVLVEGPHGIRVAPAGSGIRALTALTPPQWMRLRGAFAAMSAEVDFLIVDSAPGISDNVLDLARLTDRVIVLTSHEPTAVVDAYAVIKLMTSADRHTDIGVVVNGAADAEQGQRIFGQLDAAAKRFLHRSVAYYGFIAHDPNVGGAVVEQQPLVSHQPESPASRCFRRLALRVANWTSRGPAAGATAEGPRPACGGAPRPADEDGMEAPRCA